MGAADLTVAQHPQGSWHSGNRSALYDSSIYADPEDKRVLNSSTLIDVAATTELLRETAAERTLILENTEWRIRLLSKSPLLKLLVTKNMIPAHFHHRLILGFSTGTLDDNLAAAIEIGTGKVSKRIAALHELQDLGIRTFAMICPSLPYGKQEEYDEFNRTICAALRMDRCEHVWAEVINLRGHSLPATVTALRGAGYEAEAFRLEGVSGPGKPGAWEEYARMTFEAHKKNVPTDKLRFLQYITPASAAFWSDERQYGAVLLGRHAEENNLVTIASSAPSVPLPDTEEADLRYREEREEMITRAVHSGIAAAVALYQIKTYKSGILWRKDFRTFEEYCRKRWDYQKTQAYRLVQTGAFMAKLAESDSPPGEKIQLKESHLRQLFSKVPEELQIECWLAITTELPKEEKLTASMVASKASKFLKSKGIPTTKSKRIPQDSRAAARSVVERLETDLARFVPPEQFRPLLDQLLKMIDQGTLGEDATPI